MYIYHLPITKKREREGERERERRVGRFADMH